MIKKKKLIKHPAEIVCHACSSMNFWTGLHKAELQVQITEGVKILLSTACRILASQQPATPPPRLLPVVEEEEQEDED